MANQVEINEVMNTGGRSSWTEEYDVVEGLRTLLAVGAGGVSIRITRFGLIGQVVLPGSPLVNRACCEPVEAYEGLGN